MPTTQAPTHVQAAIITALQEFTAGPDRHTPWMPAGILAQRAGASGPHDPEFEAAVQSLYAAGVIRLMGGGAASGSNFYSAMLIPTDLAPSDPA